MTIRDEQQVAHAVSRALASDDPEASLADLMAPGVRWTGPSSGEVREVEASEKGVIVGLTWPGGTKDRVDRWHVLTVCDGRITDVLDFETRSEARAHLGRL